MLKGGAIFRRLTRKELHRAFPDVNSEYVDTFFDLYFWSLVGFLATAYEPELHAELKEAFDAFLLRCDDITMKAALKAAKDKREFQMSPIAAEIDHYFNDPS